VASTAGNANRFCTHPSIDLPDEIAESFETLGLGPDDVDLIVCTDA
jgi:hypothetical protein